MNWEAALLASSLFLLAYTWAGYPALLLALRRATPRPSLPESAKPKVSIIVAVHNEESQMAAKLEDCLALRYPPDSVEILVASDGCTDATEEIVQGFAARDSRIRLLRAAGRAGKSGAQNLAAENACGEILLFTDAGTRTSPDLLQLLAQDFVDPCIGLVASVVHFGRRDTAVSQSQGAYWRFELFLRQLESDLGILATASGAAFAIRRPLFLPIPAQFGDDCIVPLDVRLQAFRVLQDGDVVVSDQMPCSVEAELRARIRMTARNWGGIFSRPGLLNPFRFPGTAWGLLSHKFLRWLTPFFLAAMFLANALLASRSQFRALFALQVFFYVAALIGWRRSRQRQCAA
ncbi:MAG: glycosyltransferase, partial [Candidatus Sulfotelmatobacter sp.]